MSIACSEILSAFPQLLKLEKGDGSASIQDVCPSEKGLSGSILFISSEKNFLAAIKSPAAALVVPSAYVAKAAAFVENKTLLSSPNVTLAMALVIERFFNTLDVENSKGIHSTAQIDSTSKIAKSAQVCAYAVVGKNCVIGENAKIKAHVVIEDNVKIGNNSVIMPHVYIGQDTQIGNFCEIKPHCTIASQGYGFARDEKGAHYRIPQRGIVIIEDHVSIGASCTIDRATFENTKIGEGTKTDNHIHVAHNCEIGKHCLLAGGVMIAGSTKIGNNVVIGGHSSIGGHLEICDNVQLGGRSTVPNDIKESGLYSGHPVELLKDHLKTQASVKKVHGLIKDVRKIMAHLGIKSADKDV